MFPNPACGKPVIGKDGQPRADGFILGVESIEGPAPYYDRANLTTRERRPGDPQPPLSVLLSRSRYWQQDGHLEVLAFMDLPDGVELDRTQLHVRLLDEAGKEKCAALIKRLPGLRVAFYPALPAGFIGAGRLVVSWRQGERVLAEETNSFRVERYEEPAPRAGRIPIRIPNPEGAVARGLPVTVGVPFPRGILPGIDRVRLVDEAGAPVPFQISETGRWSKFGTVKWVQCDFTMDLAGAPREVFLEYGPAVSAGAGRNLKVEATAGFPRIEAGRLRFDGGVWFDATGKGGYVKVLDERALAGGFVEHEDGRFYRMPVAGDYQVEEVGPEKVVLRRDGWYREAKEGRRFCKYEVRWVIHRNSPLLRVFHTWIYTGDSDRDRIRNMGWELPLVEARGPGSFLTTFGTNGEWVAGDYLLQHEYNEFEVTAGKKTVAHPGGRAPGVALASLDGAKLYFGARDFWQAYPSELEFRDGSLWFHNWPRHGKPRSNPPVDPKTAILLKFAHQGKVLDLRLPVEYTQDPIDITHCGAAQAERMWARGKPETVNAQGVARTEEFWLYLAPLDADPGNAARLLAGINEETLRAVADPAWVIGSGVFFEAYQKDPAKYPRFEELYAEKVAQLDINDTERLGLYGKWLYGEALWSPWVAQLGDLYRALRKGHGGYGRLSWLPYARSGDPRLLKRHDAAMRRIIDADFCHYVSEDVAQKAIGAGKIDRRIPGFWICGALPWAAQFSPGVLDMHNQPHQWWSAWHLEGYHRARDMGTVIYPRLAKEHAKREIFVGADRIKETVIKAMIDSYENTFDPWFLTWAHALAQQLRDSWAAGRWQLYTRNWMPGDREFHRFTGSEAHAAYYLDFVRSSPEPLRSATALAYAWHISGDEEFLRRASAIAGDLEELGTVGGLGSRVDNSWDLPMALGAFEKAGHRPPGRNLRFPQRLNAVETLSNGEKVFRTPVTAILKTEGKKLPLSLTVRPELTNDVRTYWVYGPDGKELMAGTMTGRPDPGGATLTEEILIPAEAPAGVYHLFCEIHSKDPKCSEGPAYTLRGLIFPASPPGTPEVFVPSEERMSRSGHYNPYYVTTHGYFFHVPKDVDGFSVRDIQSSPIASIWDPDGGLAWESRKGGMAPATITVRPEHRGRLWRIRGEGFIMDPKIPPCYAIDADRWFDHSPYRVPKYPVGAR